MGIKHKSKYQEGDIIEGRFTLLYNFRRDSKIKGKTVWRWHCKCICGNEFDVREDIIPLRFGCHSCTNKKTSTETALKKHQGVTHIGLKNRLYKDYKAGANKRNLEFKLTFDQFVTIMEQDCVYCGAKPTYSDYELQYMQKTIPPWNHNGIDRVDTSKGYTISNSVPCCSKCNYAKHDMSVSEFYNWINRVYNHITSSSTTIPEGSTLQANGSGNGEHPTDFREFPQFNKYRNQG